MAPGTEGEGGAPQRLAHPLLEYSPLWSLPEQSPIIRVPTSPDIHRQNGAYRPPMQTAGGVGQGGWEGNRAGSGALHPCGGSSFPCPFLPLQKLSAPHGGTAEAMATAPFHSQLRASRLGAGSAHRRTWAIKAPSGAGCSVAGLQGAWDSRESHVFMGDGPQLLSESQGVQDPKKENEKDLLKSKGFLLHRCYCSF